MHTHTYKHTLNVCVSQLQEENVLLRRTIRELKKNSEDNEHRWAANHMTVGSSISVYLPIVPLCAPSQGIGVVRGAVPKETSGGEGGAGSGEYGSVGGAEPVPDDGVC